MKLYHTAESVVVVDVDGVFRAVDLSIDEVFTADDPIETVGGAFERSMATVDQPRSLLAPIGSQEVWAAGVTYEVSREARMAESEAAGTSDVYAKVYDAVRPEIFFKATAHRVVGPDAAIRIRSDAGWSVPEPELTLAISASGAMVGVCAGNDVSSRDIEGENPLYLPQAKVYDASAALGPAILLGAPPTAATIELVIERGGEVAYSGSTTTARIRRPFGELVDYLFRDNSFPSGCFLMTGAGVVPEGGFTLHDGDVVSITVDGVGTLRNRVVQAAGVTGGD